MAERGGFWQKISNLAKSSEKPSGTAFSLSEFDNTNVAGHSLIDRFDEQRKRDFFIRSRELQALRRLMQQKSWAESDDVASYLNPASALSRQETLKRITEIEQSFSRMQAVGKGQTMNYTQSVTDKAEEQASEVPDLEMATIPSDEYDKLGLPIVDLENKIKINFRSKSLDLNDEKTQHHSNISIQDTARSNIKDQSNQSSTLVENISTLNVTTNEVKKLRNKLTDEAAILYSKGEEKVALLKLREALTDEGGYIKNLEVWEVYFDMLRLVGDSTTFNVEARRYGNVLTLPMPKWRALSKVNLARSLQFGEAQQTSSKSYICSRVMGIEQANKLLVYVNLALVEEGMEIDFSALNSIVPSCAQVLHRIFLTISKFPGNVRFIEIKKILFLLEEITPINDANVDRVAWQAKLEVLRCLNDETEFERQALDYSMIYSISVPMYDAPKCRIFNSNLTEQQKLRSSRRFVVKVSGDITANKKSALLQMLAAADRRGDVRISLEELKRIDYVSAQYLLNWTKMLISQGRSVSYEDVNRVIAVFLSGIGITDYANIELTQFAG